MKSDPFKVPNATQEDVDPSVSSLLREMWTLQREALKEMIEGIRRLETSQVEFQAGIARQLEAVASRTPESSVAKPHPEFVQLLDQRFGNLESSVGKLDASLRNVLGESDAGLQGQLQETQDVVYSTLAESREAVQADLAEIRSALRETIETSSEAVQSAVQSALQPVMETALQKAQTTATREVEREVIELRDVVTSTQRSLQSSLDNTRQQVEEIVAGGSAVNKAELEKVLKRLLDELGQVGELRDQVHTSLKELTREVHDVTAVAGRLESSTVLTQELLDEQRQITVSSQERDRREEARRQNNAGVLCYHQGAYDSSMQHFERAVALDESLVEAHNNLGLSYTELGDDEKASKSFQKALELDPSAGQVYNNLGYLYHKRGNLEDAVEMYQHAIQRNTDTSSALTNLGNALYEMKRVDEAVKTWRQAVEIDPGNNKAAAALERLGLEVPTR